MKSKDQILLEEAYKTINESPEQNFSYYSGPAEDVMLIDNLDVPNLKRKMTQEGKMFKTVYIASREDAVNYNYPDEQGHDYYVFYEAQDFTKPALIPV